MAEESNLQATHANGEEERLSDDWSEDLTDDDYCSVISSDCSVAAPPFSPIAGHNDNEDTLSLDCSVTAPPFSPIAGHNDNENTCLGLTCDELCKFNQKNHTTVKKLYIIICFRLIQLTSI